MNYHKGLPKVARFIGAFTIIYILGWQAFIGIFLWTVANVLESLYREEEIKQKLNYLLPYAGK